MPNENAASPFSTDPAVRRLEDLIAKRLPALAIPGHDAPEYIRPKITAEEAHGFLRAIDAGLFELSDNGQCRPRWLSERPHGPNAGDDRNRTNPGSDTPLVARRNDGAT
jgi:hypothetical protein